MFKSNPEEKLSFSHSRFLVLPFGIFWYYPLVSSGITLWYLLVLPFGILWYYPLVSSGITLWYLLVLPFGIFWYYPLVSSGITLWYLLVLHFGIFWYYPLVSSGITLWYLLVLPLESLESSGITLWYLLVLPFGIFWYYPLVSSGVTLWYLQFFLNPVYLVTVSEICHLNLPYHSDFLSCTMTVGGDNFDNNSWQVDSTLNMNKIALLLYVLVTSYFYLGTGWLNELGSWIT